MEWITENWLFILFAVIFIGMHLTGRGCCGGNGKHGKRDDEDTSSSKSDSSKKETGNSCH